MDFGTVVRIVDNFRDTCPGTVNGNKLIPIYRQYNRRLRVFRKLKNIIYLEEGTRNIWYKRSRCNAGVVMMGFSLSRLDEHPKSVTMEQYALYFLDEYDPKWLKRNDFVKIHN
jgi:hypothetical protein